MILMTNRKGHQETAGASSSPVWVFWFCKEFDGMPVPGCSARISLSHGLWYYYLGSHSIDDVCLYLRKDLVL